MSTETHRVDPDQWLPVFRVEDDGCEFSPSCFNCPFPQCKHDLTSGQITSLRFRMQHQKVLSAIGDGLTKEEAAVRFGLNIRTIYRIVRRA